jgi:hypothetical protein
MEYALYNGLRSAAQPGLKALCEHCGTEVIAKCGSKKIWHWAHTTLENCDSWYEPETAWHRHWKQRFGKQCSEIRILREGVYHIADVLNKDGIVFEFQNSSISSEVIAAREAFYGEKMIWVINGEAFKSSFKFLDDAFLSDWELKTVDEFEAAQHYRPYAAGLIIEDWRLKQDSVKSLLKHRDFVHLPDMRIYVRPIHGPANKKALEEQLNAEIEILYNTQKSKQDSTKGSFAWLHPRRSWEDTKRPVFLDFGDDHLYRVTQGMGKEQGQGVKISKEKFVEKYGG